LPIKKSEFALFAKRFYSVDIILIKPFGIDIA